MGRQTELNDFYQNFISVFCFLRRMKNEGKDLKGARCLRGRQTIGFYRRKQSKNWERAPEKDHK